MAAARPAIPDILPLRLTPHDCERLRLHARILRERAASRPAQAPFLLSVAQSLEKLITEKEYPWE